MLISLKNKKDKHDLTLNEKEFLNRESIKFEYLSSDEKELYRQSMITCDLLTPTYHIELLDKPTLVWDFHSLLLVMQMMFSFMLTNENSGLKLCRKCTKAFVSEDKGELYCGECKKVKKF